VSGQIKVFSFDELWARLTRELEWLLEVVKHKFREDTEPFIVL
jgi:hypothetical protein